jgi:hypothetical protein
LITFGWNSTEIDDVIEVSLSLFGLGYQVEEVKDD